MKLQSTAAAVGAATVLLLVGTTHIEATDPIMGEMQVDRKAVESRFGERPYPPWAEAGFPHRAYWGDTHLVRTLKDSIFQ